MGLIKPRKSVVTETHTLSECMTIVNTALEDETCYVVYDMSAETSELKIIMESESGIRMGASASTFGDADSADVVTGKTFTSVNGLKIVGTGELKEKVSVTITSYVNDTTKVYYEGGNFTLAAKGSQSFECCVGSLVAIETPTVSSNASITNGQRVLGSSSYGNKEVVVFKVQPGSKISID